MKTINQLHNTYFFLQNKNEYFRISDIYTYSFAEKKLSSFDLFYNVILMHSKPLSYVTYESQSKRKKSQSTIKTR